MREKVWDFFYSSAINRSISIETYVINVTFHDCRACSVKPFQLTYPHKFFRVGVRVELCGLIQSVRVREINLGDEGLLYSSVWMFGMWLWVSHYPAVLQLFVAERALLVYQQSGRMLPIVHLSPRMPTLFLWHCIKVLAAWLIKIWEMGCR